jgi:hypothetical protein
VRALLLLADSAQVSEGKLYILGGGWSVTGPLPTPSAVAIKIDVPWDGANVVHRFELQLLTADGPPVKLPTVGGLEEEIKVEGDFEVGRPPGLRPGTPIDVPLAVNIGPMPLPPDSRYVWKLSIDGDTNELWQVAFSTRPMPPGVQMGQIPPA